MAESGNDPAAPAQPLLRLYELISGPADQERPWREVSSLFLPEARLRYEVLGEDGSLRRGDWSVAEFAHEAGAHYRRVGFWEREIFRKTEVYGNIAHILSTYESRINDPQTEPITRGINSVQLLKRDGKWKIASIIFHIEQPHTPIPNCYLSTGAEPDVKS